MKRWKQEQKPAQRWRQKRGTKPPRTSLFLKMAPTYEQVAVWRERRLDAQNEVLRERIAYLEGLLEAVAEKWQIDPYD